MILDLEQIALSEPLLTASHYRFKEKYHPEVLEKKKQEIAALAQRNYAGFAAEYEEGNIDVNGVETDLYYSEQASTS